MEENNKKCKEKLRERGTCKKWKELKNKVKEWKEVSIVEEYKRERKKLRERQIGETEWKKRKKEYKELLESKKRNKAKEWLEEIEKGKSMGLFWKAVGGNMKKEQIDKSITKSQWKEHFRSLYIIGNERTDSRGEEIR